MSEFKPNGFFVDKSGNKVEIVDVAARQMAADNKTAIEALEGNASGEDGGYYIPGVSQTSEMAMRVSFTASKEDMPGVNAVDVLLPQGAAGKTPVKGTDYWTAADQESIVQQVIAALGTPVFGRVEADNSIILTGALAEGTYTIKYEDADGNLMDVGEIDLSPAYTNALRLAVDADGTPYNGGKGWKSGYRLNSSGIEKEQAGLFVTGFIPVKLGDVIYLDGVGVYGPKSTQAENAAYRYFATYDANKQLLTSALINNLAEDNGGAVYADSTSERIIQINTANAVYPYSGATPDWRNENMAYFRLSADDMSDASIITVNEPIE